MESRKVSFVTKKVLVTFSRPLCIMIGQDCIFTEAAICEYQQKQETRSLDDIARHLVIVALPSGRRIDKSLNVTMSYSGVFGIVELDS